jgi:hypothetical protein
MYVHNNGKGWAVFRENPAHPHQRPFAWLAETREWSLVSATYYPTRREAVCVMKWLEGGEME